MEVPNHLKVFDLKEDIINHNEQKVVVPASLESSNVQNPYEEVKMMQRRIGAFSLHGVFVHAIQKARREIKQDFRKEICGGYGICQKIRPLLWNQE